MSGFELVNWGDGSRMDVEPKRFSRDEEDGDECTCSLTEVDIVAHSEGVGIGDRRPERFLDGSARGFGFRVSDGDEVREWYPVFRLTSSVSLCRLRVESAVPADSP